MIGSRPGRARGGCPVLLGVAHAVDVTPGWVTGMLSPPGDQSVGVFPGGSANGGPERAPGGPMAPPKTAVILDQFWVLSGNTGSVVAEWQNCENLLPVSDGHL